MELLKTANELVKFARATWQAIRAVRIWLRMKRLERTQDKATGAGDLAE